MIELCDKDCLEQMNTNIPKSFVDLILTDPPYGIGNFMKKRNTALETMRDNFFVSAGWDNMNDNTWTALMSDFFKASAKVLKVGGSMIMFMSLIKVGKIIKIAESEGFYYKTTGIWHKTNPMPRNMNFQFVNSTEAWLYFVYGKKTGTFNNQGVCFHDFIETSATPKNERTYGKHPTQKPEKLMEHFITLLTNPGDLVFDPFMGSGTTGVAAQRLGRNFIGCEVNPNYFQIAASRISEQKAV